MKKTEIKEMHQYNVNDLSFYKYPFSKNEFRSKKMIHAFALETVRFNDYMDNLKIIKNEK
jgi:hypothetical protein